MIFELYQTKDNQLFTISENAIRLAGVKPGERLVAHVDPDTVIVLKKNMTAMNVVNAIAALDKLSEALTEQLITLCGECTDCGDCEREKPDCGCCAPDRSGGCCGLSVPDCFLEMAGISADASLAVEACDGKITLTAAVPRRDPLEVIPDHLLDCLLASDICVESLRALLESGEPIGE